MCKVTDDVPASRISSFSGGGNCVAVTEMSNGSVAVRHSRRADPQIIFTHSEWAAFVAGVKNDEFDLGHDPEQA